MIRFKRSRKTLCIFSSAALLCLGTYNSAFAASISSSTLLKLNDYAARVTAEQVLLALTLETDNKSTKHLSFNYSASSTGWQTSIANATFDGHPLSFQISGQYNPNTNQAEWILDGMYKNGEIMGSGLAQYYHNETLDWQFNLGLEDPLWFAAIGLGIAVVALGVQVYDVFFKKDPPPAVPPGTPYPPPSSPTIPGTIIQKVEGPAKKEGELKSPNGTIKIKLETGPGGSVTTAISNVPLPSAIWLFVSVLPGLLINKEKRYQAA